MDPIVLEWVLRVALHSRNAHTKHRDELRRIAYATVDMLRAARAAARPPSNTVAAAEADAPARSVGVAL